MSRLEYFVFSVSKKALGVVLVDSVITNIKLGLSEKNLSDNIKNEFSEIRKKVYPGVKKILIQYMTGKSKSINLPNRLEGMTELQKKTLHKVKTVTYGSMTSYSELATRIGNPALARVVGSILSKNPLPLIIPCHRILKKTGELGGFMGKKKDNTGWKEFLLNLESKNLNHEFCEKSRNLV